MKNCIDATLRREIKEKTSKILESPSCYNSRRKVVNKELRTIGDVYSFWIENPELRRRLYLENKSPDTLKKMARKGIQSMHNGWNYLTNPNLTEGLFYKVGENDFDILKILNALVMGASSKDKLDFRNYRVTLNCENYMPPEPDEIPERMKDAYLKINSDYLQDPLEASITWHLEGAAIQPFGDGNKRTFRLIEDKLLDESGLPPAIIPAGEAKYYLNLLCKTLPAYARKDIGGQKEFYNYCASKVNNGLDEILGDLNFSFSCK